MTRTVVVRHEAATPINVNDEIGLEPYASYTLEEHLEDRASGGVLVLARCGNTFVFTDGSTEILQQKQERIAVERIDEETRDMILSVAAMRLPVNYARPMLPV